MKRALFALAIVIVFSPVFFLLAGCKASVPAIEIESPEAAVSPMWVGVASVFMKIVNTGGGDDVLVDARTDIPGTVTEMHDIQDGKMVKVESIPVPANGSVVLRPAKFHLMIFKMPKTMKAGSEFNLSMSFKKSGEKVIPLQLTTFAPGRALKN